MQFFYMAFSNYSEIFNTTVGLRLNCSGIIEIIKSEKIVKVKRIKEFFVLKVFLTYSNHHLMCHSIAFLGS